MSLVYESSSTLPIGVRNSIVNTTIESFEAKCLEAKTSSVLYRRKTLELLNTGFAEKIIFHILQSNIKLSNSLDRTTTPLIIRRQEAEDVYVECFWLCYHQIAVVSTSTSFKNSIDLIKEKLANAYRKYCDLGKKRLSSEGLTTLLRIFPIIMVESVCVTFTQLFPGSIQYLEFLNYKTVVKKEIKKIFRDMEKLRKKLNSSSDLHQQYDDKERRFREKISTIDRNSLGYRLKGSSLFQKALQAQQNKQFKYRRRHKNISKHALKKAGGRKRRKSKLIALRLNQQIKDEKAINLLPSIRAKMNKTFGSLKYLQSNNSKEEEDDEQDLQRFHHGKIRTSASMPQLTSSTSIDIKQEDWQINIDSPIRKNNKQVNNNNNNQSKTTSKLLNSRNKNIK